MDLTDEVLLDLKQYEMKPKSEKSFRIIEEDEEDGIKQKTIELTEYEIEKREENDKSSNCSGN